MDCLDFDTLHAFSHGLLRGSEYAVVDAHLDSCELCRVVVAEYQRGLSEKSGELPSAATLESAFVQRGALFGRFVVLDYLGAGAAGVVCAAYDAELDRKVALKILRLRGDDASADRQRFEREARAMAKVVHPNVIAIFESGITCERAFIAMEFVAGGTLRHWLSEAPRTPAAILAMFLQAGRGLAAAHALGVLHRDFKPDNVMVGSDGRARVSDFGLAGLSQSWRGAEDEDVPQTAESPAALQLHLTRSGTTHGTPRYMAPERLSGSPGDARSDQFSFCVALFEALFGEQPFAATSLPQLRREVEAGAIRKVNRRGRMSRRAFLALEKGLAADPTERFATMDELLDALAYDPAIVRRRVAVGIGVAAVLATSVPGYLHWMRASRGPCGDIGTVAAGVWDDAQRNAARQAFEGEGAPHAASGFALLDRRLSSYVDGFRNAFEQACGAAEDSLLARGERECLLSRLEEARAVTRLFTSVEDVSLETAVNLANRLTPVSSCGRSPAGVPSPRPHDETLTNEDAQREVLLAEALYRADRQAQALEIALRLEKEARQTSDSALLARSLYVAGGSLMDLGRSDASQAALREAALIGEKAGRDELAGFAYLDLSWLDVHVTHQCDQAAIWLEQAEGSFGRVSGNAYYRAMLLWGRGDLLFSCRREAEQALPLVDDAVGLFRAAAPETPHLATALDLSGHIAMTLGRLDEALTREEEVLKQRLEMFGPDDPLVVSTRANLGHIAARAGRFDMALERLDEARATLLSRPKPENAAAAQMLASSAEVLEAMGRSQEAFNRINEALPILRQGPNVSRYVGACFDAATFMRSLNMHDQARASLEEVACTLENRSDPSSRNLLGRALGALGGIAVDTGRLAQARTLLARAHSLLDGPAPTQEPGDLADLAMVDFELARLDWVAGQRGGAVTRAQQAAQLLAAQLPKNALLRRNAEKVGAWLASHVADPVQREGAR